MITCDVDETNEHRKLLDSSGIGKRTIDTESYVELPSYFLCLLLCYKFVCSHLYLPIEALYFLFCHVDD